MYHETMINSDMTDNELVAKRLRRAQIEAEEAIRGLAQAQAVADRVKLNSFTVAMEIYLVMARRPDFSGPFVGHSEEGIIIFASTDREAAENYALQVPAPAGYVLLVEPLKVRGV